MRFFDRAIVTALLAGLACGPVAAKPHGHAKPDRSKRAQTGIASVYGRHHAGRKTASGAPLSPDRMTAASPTLPLGTRARVVNKKSGKSAQVTITDRGPFTKGRVLDVTPKAAEQLGITKEDGVAPVEVKPVSEPKSPDKGPGA